MEYRLPVADHDGQLCEHIGQQIGQTDWSIEHREEGGKVVLTFPNGIASSAVSAAIASYPGPSPNASRMTPLERLEVRVDALEGAREV